MKFLSVLLLCTLIENTLSQQLDFTLAEQGSDSCPSGTVNIGQDECLHAVELVVPKHNTLSGTRSKLVGADVPNGWSHVPAGCSSNTAVDGAAHWNANNNGVNNGRFSLLCRPAELTNESTQNAEMNPTQRPSMNPAELTNEPTQNPAMNPTKRPSMSPEMTIVHAVEVVTSQIRLGLTKEFAAGDEKQWKEILKQSLWHNLHSPGKEFNGKIRVVVKQFDETSNWDVIADVYIESSPMNISAEEFAQLKPGNLADQLGGLLLPGGQRAHSFTHMLKDMAQTNSLEEPTISVILLEDLGYREVIISQTSYLPSNVVSKGNDKSIHSYHPISILAVYALYVVL